jgi:hypothetical protein
MRGNNHIQAGEGGGLPAEIAISDSMVKMVTRRFGRGKPSAEIHNGGRWLPWDRMLQSRKGQQS